MFLPYVYVTPRFFTAYREIEMARSDGKRERERERARGANRILRNLSTLVPYSCVSRAQSSLMSSSQPQEDTELPSVPKSLPNHCSVLTVRRL